MAWCGVVWCGVVWCVYKYLPSADFAAASPALRCLGELDTPKVSLIPSNIVTIAR